jgi:uncharacterized integral membrane protein
MSIRHVLAWTLVALLAIFVVSNLDTARINLFWIITAEMPVSLAILAAAILGFAAGELFSFMRSPKAK